MWNFGEGSLEFWPSKTYCSQDLRPLSVGTRSTQKAFSKTIRRRRRGRRQESTCLRRPISSGYLVICPNITSLLVDPPLALNQFDATNATNQPTLDRPVRRWKCYIDLLLREKGARP